MTIVIAGIPSEPPIRMAIESAERAGIDHVVVNQRRAAELEIEVVANARGVAGRLGIDGRDLDLDDVTGVYWRMIEQESIPESGPHAPSAIRARAAAFVEVFTAWVETAPCRVANRIAPMGSNASKPFQALRLEKAGLVTPDTVITNEPAAVQAARERWGPLVYKSVSSVRSIVRSLDDDTDLSSVHHLPTQFQRTVDGTDVRVHVVGDDVFATEIVTTAVDYRYAARDGEEATLRACELPADVANRCRAVSDRLDLPFCGIDLRRTDAGWVCFEANPSPGYSYYQATTGQPISDALVRWLVAA